MRVIIGDGESRLRVPSGIGMQCQDVTGSCREHRTAPLTVMVRCLDERAHCCDAVWKCERGESGMRVCDVGRRGLAVPGGYVMWEGAAAKSTVGRYVMWEGATSQSRWGMLGIAATPRRRRLRSLGNDDGQGLRALGGLWGHVSLHATTTHHGITQAGCSVAMVLAVRHVPAQPPWSDAVSYRRLWRMCDWREVEEAETGDGDGKREEHGPQRRVEQ